MVINPRHLGDGAYVSIDGHGRGYVITANHHDPEQATDRVFLGRLEMKSLIEYVQQQEASDAE